MVAGIIRHDLLKVVKWPEDKEQDPLNKIIHKITDPLLRDLLKFYIDYFVMSGILARQPRDIVLNLCQYGMRKVWEWGREVGGNSWRTAGALWSDVGVEGKQRVRDLWRQEDIGVFEDVFEAYVARHGVVMVRMWPDLSSR